MNHRKPTATTATRQHDKTRRDDKLGWRRKASFDAKVNLVQKRYKPSGADERVDPVTRLIGSFFLL